MLKFCYKIDILQGEANKFESLYFLRDAAFANKFREQPEFMWKKKGGISMQYEITETGSLLDEYGRLARPGWARRLLLNYDRTAVKASGLRIKEWDYYCILSDDYGAAFTIADNGYMGFVSATLLDFGSRTETTKSIITPFPLGKFRLPGSSSEGNTGFSDKRRTLEFIKSKNQRLITVDFPNFINGKSLTGTIALDQPDMDTMVIATPFKENRNAFYYNQKINCMSADGSLKLGNDKISFTPGSAFAVLDWGRGVWTYSNTWYWGSASGLVDGLPFGFNIGYGFGDNSMATENMVFYGNKAHKLDQVTFHIPDDSFLKPWAFSSNDGRFEMNFTPILDRFSNSNLLIIQSLQHQVFGRFSGKAVLDNGEKIHIKDFLGFAEKVKNRW